MMVKELDAIIFDFDGTLSKTMVRLEAWFRHYSDVHNKPWPFTSFDDFLETFNLALEGDQQQDGGMQGFYDSLGLPCDLKDKSHPVWDAYNTFNQNYDVKLVPGMKEVLGEIYSSGSLQRDPLYTRRVNMGILTSNTWASVAKELERAQVLHYFNSQVSSEVVHEFHGTRNAVVLKKPSNVAVALSLSYLGAQAHKTIHLCDTLSDLMASRDVILPGRPLNEKSDLIAVGVSWGFDGRKKLEEGATLLNGRKVSFDYIIDEPQELINILESSYAPFYKH